MSLARALSTARARRFTGRADQTEKFDQFMAAEDMRLLFVSGPGGMGKTTLLRWWCDRAMSQQRPVVYLDLREVFADRASVLNAVRDAGNSLGDDGLLFLDTFELHAKIEACFRNEALPALGGTTKVVIGGRLSPSSEWLRDIGWRPLMVVSELGPLSPEDSEQYLNSFGIAKEHSAEICLLARGYPLGLAVLAELPREDLEDAAADSEALLAATVMSMLDYSPSQGHRDALFAASMPASFDAEVLAEILDTPDAGPLYSWLQRLSCVQFTQGGISLHDIFRDLVHDTFINQSPSKYLGFADRLGRRNCRMQASARTRKQCVRAFVDFNYGWRGIEPFRSGHTLRRNSQHYLDSIREEEHGEVVTVLERFASDIDIQWVPHWMRLQPENFHVFRNKDGTLAAFLQIVEIQDPFAARRSLDPLIASAARHAIKSCSFEHTKKVLVIRFWTDMQEGLESTAATSDAIRFLGGILTTTADAAMVLGFNPTSAGRDFFILVATGFVTRIEELDITVGEQETQYQGFGNDYEARPADRWMTESHARAYGFARAQLKLSSQSGALAQDEVCDAIASALESFGDDLNLSKGDITRCLGIALDAPPAEVASQIRSSLRAIIDRIGGTAVLDESREALVHGCEQPGLKHTAAANELGMSYRTFRRRRKDGLERAAGLLIESRL
tara:strand:+ start:7886 stop:9907 length:2022 start_codon:yes stop_codon:yes gene_type:complete